MAKAKDGADGNCERFKLKIEMAIATEFPGTRVHPSSTSRELST